MASSLGMPHNPKISKSDIPGNLSANNQNGDNLSQPFQVPAASKSEEPGSHLVIDGADEDAALAQSEFLTREEVLRRRSRRVKQLARFYCEQYWALMEEVRVKYRQYYWEYGKSPFKEDQEDGLSNNREGDDETGAEEKNRPIGIGVSIANGSKSDNGYRRCAFSGCKLKAMPLTSYCHQHILSDAKQKLYKPCLATVGQVACGKPVLRSVIPSLCNYHLQRHQKILSKALKKGGFNVSMSGKVPKFSALVAEFVRQIQSKRMHAQTTALENGKGSVKVEN